MTLERVALPLDVAINQETKTCLATRIEGKSSRANAGRQRLDRHSDDFRYRFAVEDMRPGC